jgi:protein SCO1
MGTPLYSRPHFRPAGALSHPAGLAHHDDHRADRALHWSVNISRDLSLNLLGTTLCFIAVFLSSCHRQSSEAPKRYPFTGRVVSIDASSQSAVVDGDNVPGFMDAMTMAYKIKPPAALTQLAPGDSISAEVVVQPAESTNVPGYWLENVKVTAHSKTPPAAPTTQRIPAPGDAVPDFVLTNEQGKHFSLKQYHGKVLLLTFIYTRCPFPDFCPRMSSNFSEIYQQLSASPSLANVRLLSVSFDPQHDTPKVLRDYAYSVAHTRSATLFERWQFAVPSAADLARIAQFFGLVYKPENGLITHSLSTTVISPDGKIVSWYHGGDWQVSDLVRDAVSALNEKNQQSSL